MKIQINSLEALERLIGGDTLVEIEIRGNIAQEFAKRYLKALTHDFLDDKAKGVVHMIAKDYVEAANWNKLGNNLTLKDHVVQTIKGKLQLQIDDALYMLVQDVFKQSTTVVALEAALTVAANNILNSLGDANLQKRLDRMVDAKLKEKLGL